MIERCFFKNLPDVLKKQGASDLVIHIILFLLLTNNFTILLLFLNLIFICGTTISNLFFIKKFTVASISLGLMSGSSP